MKNLSMPIWLTIVAVLLISSVGASADDGGSSGARLFDNLLDRNHDGKLDADELEQTPRFIREWIRVNKAESSKQDVSKKEFMEFYSQLLTALRNVPKTKPKQSTVPRGRIPNAALVPVVSTNGQVSGASEAVQPVIVVRRRSDALPEAQRGLDKNGDGQIALSEWVDKKASEFLAFDANGDGFLSPRELGATPSSTSSSRVSSGSSKLKVVGGSGGSGSSSGSSTVRPEVASRAGYIFNALDKDKNGTLSKDEWKQSRSTRESFKRSGVKIEKDVKLEEFQQLYQQVSDKRGR